SRWDAIGSYMRRCTYESSTARSPTRITFAKLRLRLSAPQASAERDHARKMAVESTSTKVAHRASRERLSATERKRNHGGTEARNLKNFGRRRWRRLSISVLSVPPCLCGCTVCARNQRSFFDGPSSTAPGAPFFFGTR